MATVALSGIITPTNVVTATSTTTLTNKTLTGAVMNGTVGATTPNTGAFTTLGATGVATFSAGTAALPALTTTGDTNTGIFFPAADTIAIAKGGVEAMRIDSSGNFLINTTANNGRLTVSSPCNTVKTGFAVLNTDAGAGTFVGFINSAGNTAGSITQSGTTTVLYNVTSDQRLKQNIQDSDSASNLIDALQVRKYDWKSDGQHQRYGFVAQELVNVAPEAVYKPNDTEEMMSVDYSKLVPMLVKEIQSLRQRLSAANL